MKNVELEEKLFSPYMFLIVIPLYVMFLILLKNKYNPSGIFIGVLFLYRQTGLFLIALFYRKIKFVKANLIMDYLVILLGFLSYLLPGLYQFLSFI